MKRILVIEDEFLLAAYIEDLLVDAGFDVIGPVGTLDEALEFAEGEAIHGAILDVNINGGRVQGVAAILAKRDIPFLFVTGYGRADLPPPFQDVVIVAKPFRDEDLLGEIRRMSQNSTVFHPKM